MKPTLKKNACKEAKYSLGLTKLVCFSQRLTRCLISFFLVVIIIGITVVSPAHAMVKNTNFDLAYASPSSKAPIFDPKKVFLGITPTGWSNSDDPSIDLIPPIPYQQILSEMALSGFKGSQMSGKKR